MGIFRELPTEAVYSLEGRQDRRWRLHFARRVFWRLCTTRLFAEFTSPARIPTTPTPRSLRIQVSKAKRSGCSCWERTLSHGLAPWRGHFSRPPATTSRSLGSRLCGLERSGFTGVMQTSALTGLLMSRCEVGTRY